ncbi:MAG: VOC family protein [Anaerolineales bacterium]|nr:VOC family protein [Anaerolineales bacterium]MCB9172286.1 VOC family protein [Ardenticatenales bacterium]
MNSKLGHVLINVTPANIAFYRRLMIFLGWEMVHEDEQMVAVGDGSRSLWFTATANDHANDYDGVGTNHIAFHTETVADVDATVDYLEAQGIDALFGTPRHRPEFSGAGHTYYQVMFESPDGILFEVVYIGPV